MGTVLRGLLATVAGYVVFATGSAWFVRTNLAGSGWSPELMGWSAMALLGIGVLAGLTTGTIARQMSCWPIAALAVVISIVTIRNLLLGVALGPAWYSGLVLGITVPVILFVGHRTQIGSFPRATVAAGLALFLASGSGTLAVAGATATQNGQPAPAWFADELRKVVADGGRWVADNSPYKSEQEPFDAYFVQWEWGPGQLSARGRLAGIRDGRDTPNFWTFSMHWDPGRGEARLTQIGATGIVGDGVISRDPGGATVSIQEFVVPSAPGWRERHIESFIDGARKSESARWDGKAWVPGRIYLWKLQPAKPPE